MKTSTIKKTVILIVWPALLSLAGALPAFAAEDEASATISPEAVEILKKADEAARKVTAVRFTSVVKPTGVLERFTGASEGEGIVEGWNEELERPLKFWSHMKTKPPGAEESKMLTGGGDGESYYVIDHSTKKAYEDMDPAVLGAGGQVLMALGFTQFVRPEPFKRELAGEAIEILGKEEVAGEECYQIRVVYGDGAGPDTESTWSISAKDYLPRKLLRHFSFGPQGEGDVDMTLQKLEVNPKVEAGLFKLELPEGYEQIDDFAP